MGVVTARAVLRAVAGVVGCRCVVVIMIFVGVQQLSILAIHAAAQLLAAQKAKGATTPHARSKNAVRFPAAHHIIAIIVFHAPAAAPWTLLSIVAIIGR